MSVEHAGHRRLMPIRVAVIDDHQLLAQGLQVWLNDNAQDVQCVYAGCDPDAALAADLDLVLLDIDLGAELPSAAELVDRFVDHGIAVVLVSALETGAKVRDALLSGARGYVAKSRPPEELVVAIRQASSGEFVLSRELAALMCAPAPPDLSAQELRALQLYSQGFPLKSVARRMGVSANTAKEYLDRVRAKYEASGRPARTKMELGKVAREDGLLDEGP